MAYQRCGLARSSARKTRAGRYAGCHGARAGL